MIRGATYELEITINSEDTGLPLDLSTANGILVGLYGDGKKIFGKWSFITKPGFGVVTVVNAVGGVISVPVEATDTMKALLKMSKVEVVVSMPNGMFEDNLQISIDTNIEIEVVEGSIFEGISPT